MPGITATRTFNPGDIVHIEEPFTKIICQGSKVCENCCERSMNLKSCRKCLIAMYCGKACQKKDWSDHKVECDHLKNLPETPYQDIVHLMGKIILKVKGKDWKTIKCNILGSEMSFDDIDSYLKELETPRGILYYKQVRGSIKKFIGDENMPDEDDLKKIVGKTVYRALHNGSAGADILGFYIGVSLFDKVCIPNCDKFAIKNTNGKAFELRAIKKINKGTDKITIAFQKFLLPYMPTIPGSGEACTCTDCSLPYGESVLTKIIDEERAYNVIFQTEQFLSTCNSFRDLTRTPGLIRMLDYILHIQQGVLASTNALRWRTLALKCFRTEGNNPAERKKYLMELEKCMSSVFGKYYSEMDDIYDALREVNLQLGNTKESLHYVLKGAEKSEMMTGFSCIHIG